MTLASQMTTDLDVFYNDDEFAVSAILTVGGSALPAFNVLFSNPFQMVNPATGEVETTAPSARCKATDVATAVHGPSGSTLTIAGVVYKIRGKQPIEDGRETILILSKD